MYASVTNESSEIQTTGVLWPPKEQLRTAQRSVLVKSKLTTLYTSTMVGNSIYPQSFREIKEQKVFLKMGVKFMFINFSSNQI